MSEIHVAGDSRGHSVPSSVPIPLTPPVEKPFGILKK